MRFYRQWILDGYNVMHALKFLPSVSSFEIARERFLNWVGQFQSLGDKNITVVFDANVHNNEPHGVDRVDSIYSPVGFNGDGTILSIVRQTIPKLRPNLTVVTRDLMLRDAILAYRCVVISPEAFKQEFESYQKNADRKLGKHTESFKNFYKPFNDLLKD